MAFHGPRMSNVMSEVLQPDPAGLKRAAEYIQSGSLVAFPTETVYGLGADALDDTAVASIYAAKGRPSFNPLIIHVPSIAVAEKYVVFSDIARRLADNFWPGALTLVLPRTKDCAISKLASAGLDTLAIRIPGHRLALQFLTECGRPLAAPSANPSGSISPTTAQHVISRLGNAISGVLDGSACPVGVESTVVGFENDIPVLLRPGGITKDALESAVGEVLRHSNDGTISSPGMLLTHYAPACPVRLDATDKKPGEAFLGFGRDQDKLSDINLSEAGDLTEAAAKLFAAFHMLDEMQVKAIAVGPIPEIGLGVAINDRLRRAAAPRN